MSHTKTLGVLLSMLGAATLGMASGAVADQKDAGRAVFVDKHCVRCHAPRAETSGGPALEDIKRPQGEMELAGRLWNHVPAMFAAVSQQGVAWPRISAGEMADLMSYLGAEPARDGTPDVQKGQVTLLRKGCLKCHSLRHEGGRVDPDLAARRADYESAAAWAATMWTHSPRMAERARELGFSYPRFADDEMANLVGYLRSTATGGR